MATCSMILVGVLNIIISISAMIAIIVSHNMPNTDEYPCKKGPAKSMSEMGTFAFLVGMMGLLGTCCRSKGLQYVYLWMLLISSISSVAFFTFVNVMLPETNADDTFQNHLDGYYMDGYKPMLQKALVNDKDWYDQSHCFRKTKACDVILAKPPSPSNYVKEGCCKPPHRCGMVLISNTSWAPHSTEGLVSDDEGCKKWAAHGGFGCYECDECKAGYLGSYQRDWERNHNLMVGVITFAVMVSLISYYAIKVEKPDEEEEVAEEDDINKSSRILHQRL